jgi:hypothetical protein
MKFLLNNARSSEHRVEIDPETRQVTLTETIKFDVSLVQASLIWFLKEVKADKTVRHTYTDGELHFEYEPPIQGEWATYLHCFTIARKSYKITMGYSTTYRLLDALEGKTERLITEE